MTNDEKNAAERRRYRLKRGLPEDAVLRPVVTEEERKARKKAQKAVSDARRYRIARGLPEDAVLRKEVTDRIAHERARRDRENLRRREKRAAASKKTRAVEPKKEMVAKPQKPEAPKLTKEQKEVLAIIEHRSKMKSNGGPLVRGWRVTSWR
jgi:hypothetical protein